MNLSNLSANGNLHTHTKYCDGHDTAEEMVLAAIDLGFDYIGFSGHEYGPLDLSYCMSKKNIQKYIEEVNSLKVKYKDTIEVYLGIERDYYSTKTDYEFDYVIGSFHAFKRHFLHLPIDASPKIMQFIVKRYFHNDYMEYVKAYYDGIKDVVHGTNADIVGHFDLITKFNENNKYFDENSEEYKKIALEALEVVAMDKPIFEINTGAMARGFRTRPYPDMFLIDRIKELGCKLILTSDCHDKNNLDYEFDKLKKLIV